MVQSEASSHENLRKQLEARVGRTLCNRYTIEGLIGMGGMASVYRGGAGGQDIYVATRPK